MTPVSTTQRSLSAALLWVLAAVLVAAAGHVHPHDHAPHDEAPQASSSVARDAPHDDHQDEDGAQVGVDHPEQAPRQMSTPMSPWSTTTAFDEDAKVEPRDRMHEASAVSVIGRTPVSERTVLRT